MKLTRTGAAVQAAMLAMAGALGGLAHALLAPAPERPIATGPAPSASAAAPTRLALQQPMVAVASDGNVTLRVEQQPLEWVLEQIAAQTGMAQPLGPARPAAAAAPPQPVACPTVAAAAPDPAHVLAAIAGGTEAERFQGLVHARSNGITVPEATLRQLYETGASERLQVAAFEAWLTLRADSAEALRLALEQASYAPTAAVQREARERLAALQEALHAQVGGMPADP